MIGTDHGCIVRERVDRLKATLAFVRAALSSIWRSISSGRLTGVCCECTKVRHISRDQYFLKKGRVSVRLKERRNFSDPGWRQGFGVYQKAEYMSTRARLWKARSMDLLKLNTSILIVYAKRNNDLSDPNLYSSISKGERAFDIG